MTCTSKSFLTIFLFLSAIYFQPLYGQEEKTYEAICIGFYNLENLFDTIPQEELFLYEEFTPKGPKQWTSERYYEKLDNLAKVISEIGTDIVPAGVAILGISEVENRSVVEDLVKHERIKERNYRIVHYDSPDRRGIDVGLIYQPAYFEVTNSKTYTLTMEGDTNFKTRDQLLVSGILNGMDKIHVLVNHWSSRRGGEKASRPKRNAAGKLARHITDSLLALDKNAKIIILGDLNDDPVNPSVRTYLRARGDQKELKKGDLFNPMHELYKEGLGSLAYRDSWNLFDQVIISQGLLGNDYSDFTFYRAGIFNRKYLLQKEGAYAGYPFRTYGGGVYLGGYSDHFPVYILLIKEADI